MTRGRSTRRPSHRRTSPSTQVERAPSGALFCSASRVEWLRANSGEFAQGFGTPFNLDDLLTNTIVLSGQVNLNNIQYVRLVDIPGNGAFKDSVGNGILDNWLTTGTGGFDFRLPAGLGVGVMNSVPEANSVMLLGTALGINVLRGRRAREGKRRDI